METLTQAVIDRQTERAAQAAKAHNDLHMKVQAIETSRYMENLPTGQSELIINMVLDSVESAQTKRAYSKRLARFFSWLETEQRPINRAAVQAYLQSLKSDGAGTATINGTLSAIKKMVSELMENGSSILSRDTAQSIKSIKGMKNKGIRMGNWLTVEEVNQLLALPDRETVKGARDYALLLIAFSTGLRRSELANLQYSDIQKRDGRWLITDIVGKGGKIRSIAINQAIKNSICELQDAILLALEWKPPVDCLDGWVFSPINSGGIPRFIDKPMSTNAIYKIITGYADMLGIDLAPHDIRRTFAKTANKNGANINQISETLGHASLETTKKYIGSHLDLDNAPIDVLPFG